MKILRLINPFAVAALAFAGAQLAGCTTAPTSSSNNVNPMNDVPLPATEIKVGLLTTGDINDGGWNQLAYDGLKAIEKETGAKISNQVTKNAADMQPALRDYGDEKYDLVICHGFEYGERVKTLAAKYPGTKYTVVAGNVTQSPNVATMIPKLEDATYLLGVVAGGMTKTNTVGLIGGMKLPVIASTFEAFEQGAKSVNPKVKVLTNYVGNFEDQNAGKEAARTMIASGADILFHNADQAGKGMFNAAKEAKNVWVFGSNANQNDMAPELCLASAVIEIPRAFVELTQSVQKNTFKPEFIELNLPHKTIMVEWNEALKSKIPADVMKKVEVAQKQIESGQLKIKRNV